MWNVGRSLATDYVPVSMQICFKRTDPAVRVEGSMLDKARYHWAMGDFCHCEASYRCHNRRQTDMWVRISFVVNRARSLEIKADKSYPPEDGWVVLDLPQVPQKILQRSYAYSIKKEGAGMALNRQACIAGTYCCGAVDCSDLSVLDFSVACSRLFCGISDTCVGILTCGMGSRREEDGLVCTELVLKSLEGWEIVQHLRPSVTLPVQLHDCLNDPLISPTSTHHVHGREPSADNHDEIVRSVREMQRQKALHNNIAEGGWSGHRPIHTTETVARGMPWHP